MLVRHNFGPRSASGAANWQGYLRGGRVLEEVENNRYLCTMYTESSLYGRRTLDRAQVFIKPDLVKASVLDVTAEEVVDDLIRPSCIVMQIDAMAGVGLNICLEWSGSREC